MKKNILFGLIILSFVLAGCKQDVKEEKEASTEVTKELSGGQEEVTETPEQNTQSFKGRVIENQTFEIQLNDWGMVTFTSVAPEENSNDPEFLLVKNDKVIYEFPEIKADASDSFKQISGVKFSDVNMDGKKDVIGMHVGENEGAKFWLSIINGLKNRGVQDILIACVDGLNGFPQAIEAVFPQTEIQQCIIHQIRNTTRYVSYKDNRKVMADLKAVYAAPTEEIALENLEDFGEKWNSKYPKIYKSWSERWATLATYFKYPEQVLSLIHI